MSYDIIFQIIVVYHIKTNNLIFCNKNGNDNILLLIYYVIFIVNVQWIIGVVNKVIFLQGRVKCKIP